MLSAIKWKSSGHLTTFDFIQGSKMLHNPESTRSGKGLQRACWCSYSMKYWKRSHLRTLYMVETSSLSQCKRVANDSVFDAGKIQEA